MKSSSWLQTDFFILYNWKVLVYYSWLDVYIIQSEPPFFQSSQCTRHGKTFDTRILISWLPDRDSVARSTSEEKPEIRESRSPGCPTETA